MDPQIDGFQNSVDFTEFKIDIGPFTRYYSTQSIRLEEGLHTLQFRSGDRAGNIEADHILTINVDGTLPSQIIDLTAIATSENSIY